MSGRFIGRFAVTDSAARRIGDTATQKHIGSFHGDGYHAEREGNDLRIYHTTDDYGNAPFREEGNSGIRSTAGDARRDHGYASDQTPAELNAMARDAYPIGIRPSRTR